MKSVISTVKCRDDDELFKTLSEELPVGVCIMQDGKFCYVNSTFPIAIGYTVDELVGKDSLEIVVPEDREMVKENTIKMLKGELRSPYQFRVTGKDGSIIWVMGTVKSIQYHGRRAVLGNYMEITERKQAEERIRESETRYRLLAENAEDVIWTVDTTCPTRLTYISPSVTRLLGYGVEETMTKEMDAVFTPASFNIAMKALAEEMASEQKEHADQHRSRRLDLQLRHKNGSIVDVEVNFSLMPGADGQKDEILAVARDITGRKQMQEALGESEARYRELASSITDIFFAMDQNLRYTYWNKASEILTGVPAQDAIGKSIQEVFPDRPWRGKAEEMYRKVLKKQQPQTFVNDYGIDGRHYILEMNAYPARGGVSVFVKDITERKRAEEALRESEERYVALFDRSLDCVYVHDFEGNFLDANETALKLLGYEKKDIPHLNFASLLGQDQLPKAIATLQELRDTGTQKHVNEFRLRCKDGSFVDVEVISAVIYRNGKPYAIQGVGRDVTERKKVEEALQKSEERYRTLAENAGEAIFVIQDDVVKFINPKGVKLSGYSGEELASRPFAKFIYPDDIHMVVDRYLKRLRGELVPQTYDFRIIRKDGDIRWGELNAVPISWEDRPAVVCFMTDITERKQAVEALRQSEERYRTILEEMEDGYFEVDLGGHLTFVNSPTCRSLGYSREELMGKSYKDFTAEKDVESVFRVFNEVYRTGMPNKGFPWKVIRKDGIQGFAEASVSLLRNDKGEIIGFRGIGRDITERKRAEQALLDEAARRRILMEQSRDGIVILNQDGHVYDCNQKFADMVGYPFESMHQLTVFDWEYLYPPERTLEMIRNVDEKGDHFETEHRRKDGSTYDVEISTNAAVFARQKLVFCICRDITERKQAEEALRQSEERYRTILEEMEDAYSEVDLGGHLIFVNNSVCRDLGYSREELMGKSYKAFVVEEDIEPVFQVFHEVYRTDVPNKGFPWKTIRKDGTHGFAETSISLLRNDKGEAIGFRGVGRDITERKQAEQRLRQSEENYRALFDSSVIGTIVLDAETRKTVMANQAAAKIFGFSSPQEGVGRNPLNFVPPEDKEMVLEVIGQDLFEQDVRRTAEFRAVTKSGREIWLSVTAARIMHEGKLAGLISFADITEQKRQSERLMMTDRLASIGELAAGAAHELNNPLTSIIGFCELLMEKDAPDYIRKDLAMIRSEAQRAANVTSNLLTFARKHRPVKQLTRINDVIEEVLKLRAYAHKSNCIEVERDLASDLPEIPLDHFQMQQVIINIVINAEYFMTQAHKKGTLTVSTKRQNSSILVSFSDDGPGIAAENLGRIFDPFFTTKEAGKGTGLGLSICHGTVAEHGGQIYATSQPGKGATIFIELPINGNNRVGVAL